jgi:hypothetical protein
MKFDDGFDMAGVNNEGHVSSSMRLVFGFARRRVGEYARQRVRTLSPIYLSGGLQTLTVNESPNFRSLQHAK